MRTVPGRLDVLAYLDSDQVGGAERSLATLLRRLRGAVDITVAGTDPRTTGWVASQAGVDRVELLPPAPTKWHLGAGLAHVRAIRRLRPAVLHVNLRHPYSCQWALLAGVVTPAVQVVAVEHFVMPPTSQRQGRFKRAMARRLDAHVSVSDYAACALESAVGLPTGSVRTIRNGIDLGEPVEPRSGTAPAVVGSVARLAPEKGLDVLLRAAARLPGVLVELTGEGPERHRLETLAAELGIGERVSLRGHTDSPRSALARLDVLVVPSLEESFALVVAEGMAAGLPVLASDVGGIHEVIGDEATGQLVPAGDADALAAALRNLLADPTGRKSMGRRARARALEQLGADAMAASFLDLYRELVGQDCVGEGDGSAGASLEAPAEGERERS
ncbi:MAG: glycosyltransferase [Gaiellales bacterium]